MKQQPIKKIIVAVKWSGGEYTNHTLSFENIDALKRYCKQMDMLIIDLQPDKSGYFVRRKSRTSFEDQWVFEETSLFN